MKYYKNEIDKLSSYIFESWEDDKTGIIIKHYIPIELMNDILFDYFVLIDKSIDKQERVIPIEVVNSILKLMK